MAGVMRRIPMGHRILMSSMDGVEFSGDGASIADMMFGFYEVGCDGSSPESVEDYDDIDDIVNEEQNVDSAENKAFWDTQHEHLQGILCRTSSLETRIRKATKDATKAFQLAGTLCFCQNPVLGVGGCRNCLMKHVSDYLRDAGYNSAICKSKWRSSHEIPSGEHTYIDVVDMLSSKKGEVRVVIELNFRAEFEMARASEEYNQLIERLPEVFVGRSDRLKNLIKIICSAAKKCMKDKKMHLGPWRKQKYMQAKWFGSCKRTTYTSVLPEGLSIRLQRPKASLLTYDLLENLPSLHCTAVEVL
ncbi:putative sugar phosphate exchanger [Thalictrum thalictroides]|uniref:Putative sugar phosphate exchanger n=1 Tax=Thalictrum thalictroides TaxID=46969 RepID=A0A7J6V9T8_THATH|nr:putative sugar phosphate exchanger [Thalictrum thalictroides]